MTPEAFARHRLARGDHRLLAKIVTAPERGATWAIFGVDCQGLKVVQGLNFGDWPLDLTAEETAYIAAVNARLVADPATAKAQGCKVVENVDLTLARRATDAELNVSYPKLAEVVAAARGLHAGARGHSSDVNLEEPAPSTAP